MCLRNGSRFCVGSSHEGSSSNAATLTKRTLPTATNAYAESFPEADAAQPVLVVVQPPAGSSYTLLDNDHFKHFTQQLNNTIYAYPPLKTDPGFVRNVASYWSVTDMIPEVVRQQLHVSSAIISSDNLTSFVLITLHGAASNAPMQPAQTAYKKINDFIKYIQDKDRMASINPDNLDVRVTGIGVHICACRCKTRIAHATTTFTHTGFPVFSVDTMTAVESDMMRVEGVAAPLAMLVLGIMLRNFRLLILPLMCMGTSLATALLVMWPISIVYPVVIIVPAIVTCVVLALSVDYSLFLLSRFREESQNGVKVCLSGIAPA